MAGMPSIRPSVMRSRRSWTSSFQSMAQSGDLDGALTALRDLSIDPPGHVLTGIRYVAGQSTAQAPAQPKVLVSNSSNPTLDEGTIQRIAAAMLSYTVLEVQGGWPTIPASIRAMMSCATKAMIVRSTRS